MDNLSVLALVAVVGFCILVAAKGMYVLRPFEKGLVETLGRYSSTVDSGLRIIIPFIQKLTKVDMREQVVDVPPQDVITKDNVAVRVDAVVYNEPIDPARMKYAVGDFRLALTKLAQTNLRNAIGELTLDDALVSRDKINTDLRVTLDDATDKWGARIVRVEIQAVDPPADVTHAMTQQMKAEREKRAVILQAEGQKTSAVLTAEGAKQASILEAEGEAEAIKRMADADKYQKLTVAEGEGQAIETVFTAIHAGNPTPDLLTLKYFEALQGVADGQATKIFLPLDTQGVLGAAGAIAELIKDPPDSPADSGKKTGQPDGAPKGSQSRAQSKKNRSQPQQGRSDDRPRSQKVPDFGSLPWPGAVSADDGPSQSSA